MIKLGGLLALLALQQSPDSSRMYAEDIADHLMRQGTRETLTVTSPDGDAFSSCHRRTISLEDADSVVASICRMYIQERINWFLGFNYVYENGVEIRLFDYNVTGNPICAHTRGRVMNVFDDKRCRDGYRYLLRSVHNAIKREENASGPGGI